MICGTSAGYWQQIFVHAVSCGIACVWNCLYQRNMNLSGGDLCSFVQIYRELYRIITGKMTGNQQENR